MVRKSLAVVLCSSVVMIWWFSNDLSGQVGDGERIPASCVDINLDGRTDITDAVYLMSRRP